MSDTFKRGTSPSTGQQLLSIFKISIWPIIGMTFHPMYMLINSKVLGGIHRDEELC